MCGINLIVDKNKQLTPFHTVIPNSPIFRMMQSNIHRGPNHQDACCIEEKYWRVFMGGNRLKIIGSEDEANQPFFAEEKRYTTLYNGAIYNFYDLRNELLSLGEQFCTHSDTEVLSKLLIRNHKAAIPKLNGMFAFAFYDAQDEKFLLARDKDGMKPLFYYEDEHFYIVSSEISGILASGLVKNTLNTREISHYLQYKYASPPATFFEHIFEFQPGSCLTFSPVTPPEVELYTKQTTPSPLKVELSDTFQMLDHAETLLSDALLRHLIADVPCGLFLSGGVDSTLLLALIHKLGAPPVDTFTIVTEGTEKSFGTSDVKYARLAVKQYGNIHYEIPINADILNHVEDFVRFLDQPVADSASLLTFLLSREAKKKVGVVLSGAGADELFGGYNRHFAYYHYLKNYAFYTKAKPVIQGITQYLPTGFHHPFRSYFRLLKKFGQNLGNTPQKTFLNFVRSSFFSSHGLTPHISSPVFSENFIDDHLSFALHHDLTNYLVSDVLALSDRMSMAHSLEMRMPYLDDEVVQFANLLPAIYKLGKGQKWILKALLSRLGGKIYTHRKEGFGLPFGAWLHDPRAYRKISSYFEDDQLPVYQHVSYQKTQLLLEQHRNKREDHSVLLWSLLTLSAWLIHKFSQS